LNAGNITFATSYPVGLFYGDTFGYLLDDYNASVPALSRGNNFVMETVFQDNSGATTVENASIMPMPPTLTAANAGFYLEGLDYGYTWSVANAPLAFGTADVPGNGILYYH
jgi:hypothetical protein